MSGLITANIAGQSGLVQGTVPPGSIEMWHGTIANIPSGWVLCNGSNGTPDLRGRFCQGAADGDEANDPSPGGSSTAAPGNHSAHSVTQPADHTVTQPADHTVTQPADHTVTQPADHSVTQPSGHSTHSALASHQHREGLGRGTSGPLQYVGRLGHYVHGSGPSSTLGSAPNYATYHSGFGGATSVGDMLTESIAAGTPNAHSAHGGTAVDSHGSTAVNSHGSTAVNSHGSTAVNSHGSTAVDAHSAHSTSDSRPPFFTILYIMKS